MSTGASADATPVCAVASSCHVRVATPRVTLRGAASAGAEVEGLHLADLDLPLYPDGIEPAEAGPGVERLLTAVRGCDDLVLAMPGYHATPSGALRTSSTISNSWPTKSRPGLGGRLVGLVAVSGGGPGLHAITSLDAACRALNGWTLPRVRRAGRRLRRRQDRRRGRPATAAARAGLGPAGATVQGRSTGAQGLIRSRVARAVQELAGGSSTPLRLSTSAHSTATASTPVPATT